MPRRQARRRATSSATSAKAATAATDSHTIVPTRHSVLDASISTGSAADSSGAQTATPPADRGAFVRHVPWQPHGHLEREHVAERLTETGLDGGHVLAERLALQQGRQTLVAERLQAAAQVDRPGKPVRRPGERPLPA